MRLGLLVLCLRGALHGADGPELLPQNVANAADGTRGRVCPGEIVVVSSSGAGPERLAGAQLRPDGKVATLLGGTRILFDGIPAPMTYTVRGEAGAVVPYEVAGRAKTEVVLEYEGARSRPVTLPVVASAPAVFTLDGSGKGQAAMLNDSGCCNSARNPARAGSMVALYATGAGQTTPSAVTGLVSAYARTKDYPSPKLPVTVTAGGERCEIVFAGEAPHSVTGLLQVNFRLPRGVPPGGAVPLKLTVGDSSSQDGVTMAVRTAVDRVLVVEPVPLDRERLRSLLTRAGYEVMVARNGTEAREKAGQNAIDLAIVSLAMPEAERLDAVRAMLAGQPRLKIAARAPGAAGAAMLRAADLLGAQAVIAGPIVPQAVLQRVRQLLRARPAIYTADDDGSPLKFPAGR